MQRKTLALIVVVLFAGVAGCVGAGTDQTSGDQQAPSSSDPVTLEDFERVAC